MPGTKLEVLVSFVREDGSVLLTRLGRRASTYQVKDSAYGRQ